MFVLGSRLKRPFQEAWSRLELILVQSCASIIFARSPGFRRIVFMKRETDAQTTPFLSWLHNNRLYRNSLRIQLTIFAISITVGLVADRVHLLCEVRDQNTELLLQLILAEAGMVAIAAVLAAVCRLLSEFREYLRDLT